ncbi:MAG: tryptophan synthase subunit alpha [Candidatus Omnitrophica bacterium]|nr:tryptophan synthase subunit alpha [Candidatus Omnitrophota bacterium]
MNKIEEKFLLLKKRNRKAFIAFLTAGDPDLKTTEELVLGFEKSGVDIVEIGVPFSDPLADGKTIQAASQRALAKGVTTEKVFKLVQRLRLKTQIPIALMMYYNPIFHYGDAKFVAKCKTCGVDGLIIPDLPPEEAKILKSAADEHEIATVFFMAPTTTPQRMKLISNYSTGFIYFVSLTGVTGARTALPSSISKQIKQAKSITDKPICIGFGISNATHVKEMSKVADGVIVGSAIINEIVANKGKKDLVHNVCKFVKQLTSAIE